MQRAPRSIRGIAQFLVLLSLLAAACGADGDGQRTEASPRASFPVTIEAANGTVEIPRRPQRIVSLSPTGTEMLFAIGAAEQVVAADERSNYPPEAPTTDLSGLQPNIEAIADHNPDLVVVGHDLEGVVASLTELGIPVLFQPAAETLQDTYRQIEQLGAATGHSGEAAEVVARMQSDIYRLVEQAPDFQTPPTYYHELDPMYFTATSRSFIGTVYALVGLRNIADEAGDETQYPQLSAEYIIEADPDLIFLADVICCDQSAETVGARPGWEGISAVRDGAIVELDDNVASRWGPRVVDFLRSVVRALSDLEERVRS